MEWFMTLPIWYQMLGVFVFSAVLSAPFSYIAIRIQQETWRLQEERRRFLLDSYAQFSFKSPARESNKDA